MIMATAPLFVLVMRHGEKLKDPRDPHLSPSGAARAKELAGYIPESFGRPDFIFATAPSKHSVRPYETVEPLSKRTGIPIEDSYADQDYGALAADLRSGGSTAGKKGVICWHHGNIPPLLHALGAKDGEFPDPWDRDVFNLILKVEFTDGEAPKVSKVVEPF
jgi:hypothetical protein